MHLSYFFFAAVIFLFKDTNSICHRKFSHTNAAVPQKESPFNIGLEVQRGQCLNLYCQSGPVSFPPANGDCESSFVRRFGKAGVNEESFFLVPDGNGNYFIGGLEGASSLILQVDPSGNILTQRTYNFTNGNDFVANLTVDEEGFLVGSARDQLNSNTTNVLFKINWFTGNLVWAKKVDNPAYNRFDRAFQHPVSGNYMFCGMTTGAIDNYIIEADKNTGTVTWQFVSDYGANGDVYSGYFVTNNAIYYAGQGRLGANLSDIRPTLTKFDLNGNLQWAKIHLRSPIQSSRLYNMDLLIENDTIVNCGRGSLTSDDLTTSQLLFYKTNINGGLIWAKSYSVTGGTSTAGYQVLPIPGGYMVQGSYDESGTTARFFLARLNKSGNVVWAKKINAATAPSGITKPLTLVNGGFVVFAAQTTQYDVGQNHDLLFGKISLDGQVTGTGCDLIEEINLQENIISNPYDGSQLPAFFTVNYSYSNSSHSPVMADLPVSDIPGCECSSFVDTCANSPVVDIGFDTVEICPGENFTFSVSGFDSYQWFPPDLTDCDTCATITVSPPVDTCFILVAGGSDGCYSADTVCVVLVTDTAVVNMDRQICEGSSFDFFGTSLSQPGTYEHITDTGSCVTKTILTLGFYEKMTLGFETEPECPYQLDGKITVNVTGDFPPFSYEWSEGNSTTNDLAGLQAGEYSVTVTDANDCTASGDVMLEGVTRPDVSIAISDVSCFGYHDGSLTVTDAEPGLQFSFFGTPFSTQTVYDSISIGNWQLQVLDTFGCIWEEFFGINQPDQLLLQLPGDVTIELGDTVEINPLTQASGLNYSWTPDTGLSCANCLNPVAQPAETTLYYFLIEDTDGCKAVDSILITVEFTPKVYVPNVFSPNNDGLNDTFYLFGDGIAEVKILRIFDRWGEKVFEKANFPANEPLYGWDGYFKGKPMNSDVYAYYATINFLDGSEKIVKGDVTLLR